VKITPLLQVGAGIGIAAIGVWIFSRQVDLSAMLGEVRATPLWKIVVVILLNPATLFLRAWRWKIMLPQRNGCSKEGLFPLVVIGFMVNNILPARIGEAARAALLWRRNRFTIAESIGSLLVERLLDVLVFVSFLFMPILLLPQLAAQRNYGLLLSAGFCGVLLLFALYALRPAIVKQVGQWAAGKLPEKVRSIVLTIGGEIMSNLDWLGSPRRVVAVVLLSFLTLLCQIGMLQALGFGIERFGFFTSMFGVAFAALGAAIPLAPGYVGTLHAMLLQGLGMAGIAADKAGAIAVVYHAAGYITITIMGIFFFFRLKLSVGDIRRAKETMAQK
jgi:glycosyltransferase 2 family protein